MFNRMILPVAGSSMSVWNIALMCFQVLLLGGYAYTHYLPKLIGYKAYMKVHLGLLIFSAFIAFLFFQSKQFTVNTSSPYMDIIFIMLSTIGLPFFVVSTSSTNFQRWYCLIQNESPYHLYALSNSGNLLALIGYGLVVEVLLGLKDQILAWNILYAIGVVIGIYIGIIVYKSLAFNDFLNIKEDAAKSKKVNVEIKRKMYWLLLSFIPCSLMIATNTVLDNRVNVNHIPYFWILPLAIYLVSYIIAFSKIRLLDICVYEKIALWLITVILGILFVGNLGNNEYVYIMAMFVLFIISLVSNLYLVKDKPNESNLTEFYLYIAIGGALGGIFSSLIAPAIFNNIYEYPIIIIIFLFTMYLKHKKDRLELIKIEQWEYSIVFLIAIYSVIINGLAIKLIAPITVLLCSLIIRRLYANEKTRLISLTALIILTSLLNYIFLHRIDYQARNFYGIKTVEIVVHEDEKGNTDNLARLIFGNTMHGIQFEKGSQYEFNALSYYDEKGSTIGRFFTANNDKVETVGVVGLGIGSLSALSDEEQEWKYFEIDPQITQIANNTKYFTMLDRYKPEIVMGDARITLQAEKDEYYDVLVLDAYSGDMIPANLLTKEALELYQRKLKKDGIMLFHISNRQFDLMPVLSTVSEAIGMDAYIDTAPSKGIVVPGDSVWVIITNNKGLVINTWTKIAKFNGFQLWTDDKYSLSDVLINN